MLALILVCWKEETHTLLLSTQGMLLQKWPDKTRFKPTLFHNFWSKKWSESSPLEARISGSHPNNCVKKPGKALPRTNVNHLSIIAPGNKHVDCKIAYTTISTMLFACLSWKVHPPTDVTLYSPSNYWLTWLIKYYQLCDKFVKTYPPKKLKSDCFS